MSKPRTYVRTFATDGSELETVDTTVNAVPDELGFEHAALIGLLDAVRRYHADHPTLSRIEIVVA